MERLQILYILNVSLTSADGDARFTNKLVWWQLLVYDISDHYLPRPLDFGELKFILGDHSYYVFTIIFILLEYRSLRTYILPGFCCRWHGWRRDGLYFQKYVGRLTGAAWLLRLSLFFWVSTETVGTEWSIFVKKTSTVLLTVRCYTMSLENIQNMN